MPIFSLQNISKSYKVPKRPKGFWKGLGAVVRGAYETRVALDGVSMSLEEGELVGYIGPNGAGKSTTVKILSGILVPDSGRCEVMGRVPWKERVAHVHRLG